MSREFFHDTLPNQHPQRLQRFAVQFVDLNPVHTEQDAVQAVPVMPGDAEILNDMAADFLVDGCDSTYLLSGMRFKIDARIMGGA